MPKFDQGECSPDELESKLPPVDWLAFDFMMTQPHSHLCSCGYKWWHTREAVDDMDFVKAHTCPKCGRKVEQVHGWQDPTDMKHHIHHAHMIHA
jgi:hypothetical protein